MNQVYVQATLFTNLDGEGKTTDTAYGYRIFDDEGHDYNNSYSSFEEVAEFLQPKAIVRFVQAMHPEYMVAIVQHGINLNDDWHDWDEIKPDSWNEEDKMRYESAAS